MGVRPTPLASGAAPPDHVPWDAKGRPEPIFAGGQAGATSVRALLDTQSLLSAQNVATAEGAFSGAFLPSRAICYNYACPPERE